MESDSQLHIGYLTSDAGYNLLKKQQIFTTQASIDTFSLLEFLVV